MDRAVPTLLEGAALGFWAAAAPGPFQALLVARASRDGVSRALPLATVPLASDPVVIAAVVAVLGAVPGGLLRALQIGGGLFVLWLAWATLRGAGAAAAAATAPPEPRGWLRAALVNLANPNAWLFWSLVGGPLLVRAWRAHPPEAVAFLAGFYALLVGVNAALIGLFGAAGRISPRVSRGLALASGAALAAFGAWQLGSGLLAAAP
jgi:threonine/homoserine/homoserine lactone efflux protein